MTESQILNNPDGDDSYIDLSPHRTKYEGIVDKTISIDLTGGYILRDGLTHMHIELDASGRILGIAVE